MNPELIRVLARSNRQDLAADLRAERRAARLRADPSLGARVLRSILASERTPRPEQERRRRTG
jgi:hypothetical protein